jgi:hypothetical protein
VWVLSGVHWGSAILLGICVGVGGAAHAIRSLAPTQILSGDLHLCTYAHAHAGAIHATARRRRGPDTFAQMAALGPREDLPYVECAARIRNYDVHLFAMVLKRGGGRGAWSFVLGASSGQWQGRAALSGALFADTIRGRFARQEMRLALAHNDGR